MMMVMMMLLMKKKTIDFNKQILYYYITMLIKSIFWESSAQNLDITNIYDTKRSYLNYVVVTNN